MALQIDALQFYILVGSQLLLAGALYGKMRAELNGFKEQLSSDSRFTATALEGVDRRSGEDRRRIDNLLSLDFTKKR